LDLPGQNSTRITGVSWSLLNEPQQSSAQTSMSGFGQYAGLMGLAGLDTALSILIGAAVFRATVASLQLSLKKV
jgi:hypothetical protein